MIGFLYFLKDTRKNFVGFCSGLDNDNKAEFCVF